MKQVVSYKPTQHPFILVIFKLKGPQSWTPRGVYPSLLSALTPATAKEISSENFEVFQSHPGTADMIF